LLTSDRAAGEAGRRAASFWLIWSTQTVSAIGSGLTSFALGVWVYQRTGSATAFALIYVWGAVPGILLAPLGGELADRWGRRRSMLAADLCSSGKALALALLLAAGRLAVWQVWLCAAVASIATAVQMPAYLAAVAALVPARHLGRAAGMLSLSASAAYAISPALAAAWVGRIGTSGLVLIDLASFVLAAVALLAARVPEPRPAPEPGEREAVVAGSGWRYLGSSPELVALLAFLALVNLLFGAAFVLITPLVLAFASPKELGAVLSVGNLGAIGGAVLLGAWGGPARRLRGVLGASRLLAIGLLVTGLRPRAPLVAAGIFTIYFSIAILNGCNTALWQERVPAHLHGRVFAIQRMVCHSTAPLAYLGAAVLGQRCLEPLMSAGGPAARLLAPVVGSGPGRGFAVLFSLMGALLLIAASGAGVLPPLRRLRVDAAGWGPRAAG
jgi:DHA3 family macrolide efflux protein-like MFS transporter